MRHEIHYSVYKIPRLILLQANRTQYPAANQRANKVAYKDPSF